MSQADALGKILGEQIKDKIARHLQRPVAERIKEGIRADIEMRKSAEEKDD